MHQAIALLFAGSVALLTPMFDKLQAPFSPPPAAAAAVYDGHSKLVRMCYGACRRIGAGYTVIARADAFASPPPSTPGAVTDATIGFTLRQLLATFRKDANFAGKNLISGHDGSVTMVEAKDQDPPPSRYDHGYQMTTMHYYVLRDGIVVAHGWWASEN